MAFIRLKEKFTLNVEIVEKNIKRNIGINEDK